MTKLLKQAFDRAAQLPEVEQDALAAILLAEIEDEARWQASFAKSQAKLAKMARKAFAEGGGRAAPTGGCARPAGR